MADAFDSGFSSGFGMSKAVGNYSVLGPGGYPRPPYASFAGKSVAGGGGNALLLINPPGLDGGFGTGLSL